jgi:L-rhamnose isomerase
VNISDALVRLSRVINFVSLLCFQGDAVVGAEQAEPNHGEVAARMDIEVNDYPGSGANNRHEPRSPGRA